MQNILDWVIDMVVYFNPNSLNGVILELNNIFKVYPSKNETEKYRQKFSTKQKLLRGYHSGASNSVRNSVNMLLSIVMTMGNLVSLSFTAVCRTSKSPTGIVERSVVA